MNFNEYIKDKLRNNPQLKEELLYESWLKELGIRIARLRKEKGLTQLELATKMEVPQSVIARLESGYNAKCSTLWKLSRALNVDLFIFGASSFNETTKLTKFVYAANYGTQVIPKSNQIYYLSKFYETESSPRYEYKSSTPQFAV